MRARVSVFVRPAARGGRVLYVYVRVRACALRLTQTAIPSPRKEKSGLRRKDEVLPRPS